MSAMPHTPQIAADAPLPGDPAPLRRELAQLAGEPDPDDDPPPPDEQ